MYTRRDNSLSALRLVKLKNRKPLNNDKRWSMKDGRELSRDNDEKITPFDS